jgi:peptidoglycan hydrolase-like protein with peptidoglycan-binding domain
MFLTKKIPWAGIAFFLLTAGVLVLGFPRSGAGSDSKEEGVEAFVTKNEIRKMQDTLRSKGHYQGLVDGVFGLRTRASIRAYQKAEKLPITGQVDVRTAYGLGVRPESTWANSESTEVGHSVDSSVDQPRRDKPSAGIWRAKRRTSKTSRKEVSRSTAPEDELGDGATRQQAVNEKQNQ